MFRRTFTGSLVAASLAAGAFMTMPSAEAAPTWVGAGSVSGVGFLPDSADVAVSDNGNAVAAWIAGGRVMASSASHGTWGPAKFVSDAGKTVSTVAVAVNDQGDAAITWSQKDNDDNNRLTVARRLPTTSWDGWAYLDAPLDKSVSGKADIGLDAQGTLRAAYVATDGGTYNQVRVATQAKSGTKSTAFISDTSSFAPALDVNAAGAVLVSWYDAAVGEARIMSRRLTSPGGTWEVGKEVAPFGSYLAETDAALSDTLFGTVAFVQNWNGDSRAEGAKIQPDGFIGSGSFASPSGVDAHGINLDQNDAGTALLSWIEVGATNEIGYALRPQNSGWTADAIDSPVASPGAPRSNIAENGTFLVGYDGNGHLLGTYRTNPLLPKSHVDSGALAITSESTLAGMDDQGNAFLGAIRQTNPGEGEVRGSFLDVAGPVSAVSTPAHVLGTGFTVTWGGTDRLSNVTTGSIRMRSAAFNGTFSGYSYPLLNKASKTLPITGTPGRTYCFSSQAKDAVDNLGAWSAEQCTTVPVDDRALTRKGFKKAGSSAAYLGTLLKTKKKGAVLKLANVKASRIAVIVAKAPRAGKIKVTFAGQNLGTWSLKGTGSKKLVATKSFGTPKAGTLVIKVVSSTGKVVRIDGVVASR